MSSTPDDVDPTQDPAPLDPEKLLREAADGLRPGGASGSGARQHSWTLPDLAALTALFPELRIDGLVGRGGMGAVYVAVQERLDRQVALKILPRELAADPAFEERFQREAQALAGLQHPRILTLYDFGQREGLFYLVTDFVEGMNLRQLMDMGRLSPTEALRIAPQICEALQFAHDHGIVHRDIKPENILVDTEGEVHIADFGLARFLGPAGAAPQLTRSTQILGTPHYMAPEQWQGLTVDHRADIFAVGIVLYEMLTGQVPMGHYSPPSESPGVPPRLDEVVKRSLAQKPEQRYQQMSEVADDIVPRQRAQPSKSRLHPPKPARSPRMLWFGWACIFVMVIGSAALYRSVSRYAVLSIESAVQLGPEQRKVVGAWIARREEAKWRGEAFNEEVPVDLSRLEPSVSPYHVIMGSGLLPYLVFGVSTLLFLFSLSGWMGLSHIRKRKQGNRGLAMALFMAWSLPAAVFVAVPTWILLDVFRYDLNRALVALVAWFFVIGTAFLFWLLHQHGRISAELQGRRDVLPDTEDSTG